MGRAQPEQGGGIVNVAVMTGALGYREYNTTLMTMDGWTDSRGTDRHPTVVDERVNVGSFMSGDDHLYADVYCHDDEVESPSSSSGRSCSTSGTSAACST